MTKSFVNFREKINFDKTYFYALVAFAFTLPLSRAAISFFEIFFILLWILEWDFKTTYKKVKESTTLTIMGFFILFQLISIFYSSDITEALSVSRLYAYWLAIFILSTKIKPEWIKTTITAFIYGMFISEILAYAIFFDIYSINGREPDYPSPFMQHIDYSVYLAFTSILLLNRLFSNLYHYKEKIMMGIFFFSVTLNLFISIGRTGQLAFLVALFVTVIMHFRISFKSLLLFFLLTIGIFGSAYKALPIFQERVHAAQNDIQKFKNGNYTSSWGIRAAFWIISLDIVKENPLIGVGIGDYNLAAQDTLKKDNHGFQQGVINWCSEHHFHNQYLMIIVQTGLFGLSLMFLMIYKLFTLNIVNQEYKKLSILFFVVFFISCIAEPLWLKQFPLALFVLFSALFISLHKTSNTHKS